MELYQLRSFAAVAELGHLTRAAEKLHISQPALSAQIKALEDELGVALFERTPSGMTLTPAGQRLRPEATKVVIAAGVLSSHAKAFAGETTGRVRVENAAWDEIAALPWIITPPISTHSALANQMFEAHGVSPAKRIEADHEAVISSLVIAGVGVALMREDLAVDAAAANELCL